DHEVLHAARQDRAHDQPQRARQVAELRRQRRADQRARAGDRGEVVAEHDPLVGGHVVAAVVEPLGGCRARVVERQHLGRDEGGIEAVGRQVAAHRRDHEPDPVDRLAALQRDGGQRAGAHQADQGPKAGLKALHAGVRECYAEAAGRSIPRYSALLRFLGISALLFAVSSCPLMAQDPSRSVEDVLTQIAPKLRGRLSKRFTGHGAVYPPAELTLIAYKKERKLEVWVPRRKGWVKVVSYKILAASGTRGPKLREGDEQVPEGVYRLT